MVPGTAVADPSQKTIEARKELARINTEVALAAEAFNGAEIELQAAKRAAARAQARVAAKEAEVAATSRGLGELAAAAYRSGGTIDPVLRLMTSATPGTFLDKAGTLDAVVRNQSGQLRAVKAARQGLEHERRVAAQELARADAIAASMERTRQEIERKLVRQQELVRRLESADARRERLEREAAERRAAQLEAARARAAALAAAERARREALARASRTRTASVPAYNGPASGRAAIAVQEAYRQLGKPYRWGAEGPDSFDCSGLSKWAWAKAGVSLPHYSRAQYNEGRHVSQGELQPGDLVFFGNPIHHLGIYVGNGNMIHAPQTGDVVKVSSAMRSDYAGAVRL
ncbi:MAG TPA: NlpC/P60 family protein [Frankiaceae bacterium]|nr:NlpC/P60 family protein [Frankiaceae bacterium]